MKHGLLLRTDGEGRWTTGRRITRAALVPLVVFRSRRKDRFSPHPLSAPATTMPELPPYEVVDESEGLAAHSTGRGLAGEWR